jgi:hypothetical protein
MISWIMKRVKIFLWVMAVSPLLALGFSLFDAYYQYPKTKEVFDKGVETVANIEGGTRTKRRRSGTSFSVDLMWRDKAGNARAEKVRISNSLADKMIKDDTLIVDTLRIKYLESDPTAAPLILAELPANGPTPPDDGFGMALTLLPLALVGAGGLYFLRRRERHVG